MLHRPRAACGLGRLNSYTLHAGYLDTWGAGGTLRTGLWKSEQILDHFHKPAVNSVLTRGPLCPI